MTTKRALALMIGTVAAGALAPVSARADTVTDWNDYASTAIVGTASQPPPVAVLSFAMVQGAVYDAVDGISRVHRPYLAAPPGARRSDSKDAAAAAAAFRTLIALFPAQAPTLQARYDASLATVPDGPAKIRGVADGESAAATMLAARANDGRFGPFTPVFGSDPGDYRPTAPLFAADPAPWVGNVRPFLVPDVALLRTAPPNPLTSPAYTRDFDEIKAVGALHSAVRTPDQTDAAIFWQDHAFALWNRIFRTLASGLSLDDNARLFAMTNLAAADAAIGCWDNKYRWNFWRPITAIREADADGNPRTAADPSWTPLFDPASAVAAPPALLTPPFPDHPSGHNCAAGAIVRTLQSFFGTDRIGFTVRSNKSGTTRTFPSLSDALSENIDARVWAGIHFRSADLEGARLGEKVGRYLQQHAFERIRRVDVDGGRDLHRRRPGFIAGERG